MGGRAREVAYQRWSVFVRIWVVVSVGLAVWTGASLWRLQDLSDTIAGSAKALTSAAEGLDGLRELPVIGEDIGVLSDRIEEAARSAGESGRSSRESIALVAILVPTLIVMVAVVPPIAISRTVRRVWLGPEAPPSGPTPDAG